MRGPIVNSRHWRFATIATVAPRNRRYSCQTVCLSVPPPVWVGPFDRPKVYGSAGSGAKRLGRGLKLLRKVKANCWVAFVYPPAPPLSLIMCGNENAKENENGNENDHCRHWPPLNERACHNQVGCRRQVIWHEPYLAAAAAGFNRDLLSCSHWCEAETEKLVGPARPSRRKPSQTGATGKGARVGLPTGSGGTALRPLLVVGCHS